MSYLPLITLLSVMICVIGFAVLREIRLRKGLQRLLAHLLSRPKPSHGNHFSQEESDSEEITIFTDGGVVPTPG